jgi:hypothetical protein
VIGHDSEQHEEQSAHMAHCQEIAAKVTACCEDIRQRFPGQKEYVDEAQRLIVSALNRGDPEQAKAIAFLSFIKEPEIVSRCFSGVAWGWEVQS